MDSSIYQPIIQPMVREFQKLAVWIIGLYAAGTVALILKYFAGQLARIPFYIAEYIACEISDLFRFGESARERRRHHKQIKRISETIQSEKDLSDTYNDLKKL